MINTKAVSLETLYELVTLDVKVDGQSIPLQDLGTGPPKRAHHPPVPPVRVR